MRIVKRRSSKLLNFLLLISSVVAPILVIYHLGFPISLSQSELLYKSYRFIMVAQWFLISLMLVLGYENRIYKRGKNISNIVRITTYVFFSIVVLFELALHYGWLVRDELISAFTSEKVVVVIISIISGTELSRWVTSILGRKTSPPMILASSFLFIILIGSLLLKLPNATKEGIDYIDSLFLSTSAVCVTGLSPVDISQTLTVTGEVILLFLIQIGGLGVMTITSFFGLFFASSHRFAGQMVVGDLLSTNKMSGLFKMLANIIIVTLSIEAFGALMIYSSIADYGGYSEVRKWFFSVFHSISAFCNAGFSTLSGNLADPIVVSLNSIRWWVSLLIIFGGIGFPIFSNFLRYLGLKFTNLVRRLNGIRPKVHPRVWKLNTYIVLRMTIILVVGSWLAFLALEWNASLEGMSFVEKLSQSFFMAVTPRTAGFNSVDMSSMLPTSLLLTTILMWIGGAPQSTAGGIKVTTIYIALRNIFSSNRTSGEINVKFRKIPSSSVQRAFGVVALSGCVIMLSVVIISLFDRDLPISKIIFEVVSAVSTVGLSLGVTPELSDASKCILIVLMFVGRVGLVSVLILFFRSSSLRSKPYTFPEEDILIT